MSVRILFFLKMQRDIKLTLSRTYYAPVLIFLIESNLVKKSMWIMRCITRVHELYDRGKIADKVKYFIVHQ